MSNCTNPPTVSPFFHSPVRVLNQSPEAKLGASTAGAVLGASSKLKIGATISAPLAVTALTMPAITQMICVMAGMVSAVTASGADIVAPILSLDDAPSTAPAVDAPSFASGDWFSTRTGLWKKGLTVGGFVQLDMTKVLHGGVDTDSYPLRYLL